MKTKLIFCISLGLIFQFAQAETFISDSKIQKVTAYRNGAFITRLAEVDIPAGNSTIIIAGYSDHIDPQTARIQSQGKFEILSVQHKYDYTIAKKHKEEIVALHNKIDLLKIQEEEELLNKQVSEEEMKLLYSDKLISKDKKNLSIQEMTSLMDFYRGRLKTIKTSILQCEKRLAVIKKELHPLQSQINQYEQKHRRVSKFVIETYSTKARKSSIELSYWTKNVTWSSHYDVKVNNITAPLTIQSNAILTNSSGEDWENVDLVLSTGEPWISMRIPTVSPWWIDFSKPYPTISMHNQHGPFDEEIEIVPDMAPFGKNKYESKFYYEYPPMPQTIVKEHFTSTQYSIAGKRTILSNNLPSSLKLSTNEIDAKFQYVAVPAKSPYAFLKANIWNWDEFNFSYGQASLFFEGTYIGKTILNPKSTSDSLNISFGPDIAVSVTRNKSKEYSEKKWFGTKRTETIGYQLKIKNNKRSPIDIQIFDQVPVSTNESIEVDNLEVGQASLDQQTGILTWTTQIPSGKTYSDHFTYKVTFPKGKVLASR